MTYTYFKMYKIS